MTNDGLRPHNAVNNDGDNVNGNHVERAPSSSSLTSGGRTMSMTIGIAFAAFFLFVLVVMWTYLLLFVRGTCLLKGNHWNGGGKLSKDGSVTDQENISDLDDEIDPNQHHCHQQPQE